MIVYRIKDWERIYENHESRKRDNLRWVPIPNKHDGLGYRRLASDPHSAELFAAWVLLVQVASRGRKEERGTLMRDGVPLDADDAALITGFPAALFAAAFAYFADPRVGWLERVETADVAGTSDQPAANADPAAPLAPDEAAADADQPATNADRAGLNGIEGKGIEGKGKEWKGSAAARAGGAPGRPSKRCPADFYPDEQETRALAQQLTLDNRRVVYELQKFRDHTFADAKSDWPATWRNWLRTAAERAAAARATPRHAADATQANVRELLARTGGEKP